MIDLNQLVLFPMFFLQLCDMIDTPMFGLKSFKTLLFFNNYVMFDTKI